MSRAYVIYHFASIQVARAARRHADLISLCAESNCYILLASLGSLSYACRRRPSHRHFPRGCRRFLQRDRAFRQDVEAYV